jgi:hypothetical protein
MSSKFSVLVLALILSVALAGCAAGAKLAPGSPGTVAQLHADLEACLRENIAFGLIPDFGITGRFHRTKCYRERGWVAIDGFNTFSRIDADTPAPPSSPLVPAVTAPTWSKDF